MAIAELSRHERLVSQSHRIIHLEIVMTDWSGETEVVSEALLGQPWKEVKILDPLEKIVFSTYHSGV